MKHPFFAKLRTTTYVSHETSFLSKLRTATYVTHETSLFEQNYACHLRFT